MIAARNSCMHSWRQGVPDTLAAMTTAVSGSDNALSCYLYHLQVYFFQMKSISSYTENQFPPTENQIPAAENQFPPTENQIPAAENQIPPTENQFPLTENTISSY